MSKTQIHLHTYAHTHTCMILYFWIAWYMYYDVHKNLINNLGISINFSSNNSPTGVLVIPIARH